MKNRLVFLAFVLMIALGLGALSGFVRAQSGASISVVPSETILDLATGNSAQLQIYVSDVVELNAYEVTIEYNASLLSLTSWGYGPILKNLWNPVPPQNTPGRLYVTAAQLMTSGFTGEGVLLTLNFQALAEGMSAITMTQADLAQYDGDQIYPTVQNGVFKAVRKFSVSGNLGVEYDYLRAGIPVTLLGGPVFNEGPYNGLTNGQAGTNLTIPAVIRDTYIFTTAQPRCLNLTEELGKSFGMLSGNTTLAPLALVRGNAAWTNNTIDSGDVSVVGTYWGQVPTDLEPGDSLDGDVNFDGVVDLRDLAIVAGNFGLSSAQVYADWTP